MLCIPVLPKGILYEAEIKLNYSVSVQNYFCVLCTKLFCPTERAPIVSNVFSSMIIEGAREVIGGQSSRGPAHPVCRHVYI